jgi:uridine kinase
MTEDPLSVLETIDDISQDFFEKVTKSGEYKKIGELSTSEVVVQITDRLRTKKGVKPNITAQFLGSPGSGKSTLACLVQERLDGSIMVPVDDYNRGTREDRRRIIKEGGTALDEKDFVLLRQHVLQLQALRDGEKLNLPEAYDLDSGNALIKGLNRVATGSFSYIIVDGNFYVGDERVAGLDLDGLVYLHMSDRTRLQTRLTRDLVPGKMRGKDASEIVEQFVTRRELQDKLFTTPYMDKANLLIQTRPQFTPHGISGFTYTAFSRMY